MNGIQLIAELQRLLDRRRSGFSSQEELDTFEKECEAFFAALKIAVTLGEKTE